MKNVSLFLGTLLLAAVTSHAQTNTFPASGKAGIGTTSPDFSLHIADLYPTILLQSYGTPKHGVIRGNAATWILGYNGEENNEEISLGSMDESPANLRTLAFGAGGYIRMRILANGNIGVGTNNPQSKLAVNGTITATKVKVTASGWADFVFADNYQLPSLQELEMHIKAKKHLPGIPTAAEVEQNGVDVGDTQVKLLQKIEELTLYMIELNKKLEAQQNTIQQQGEEIKQLRKK